MATNNLFDECIYFTDIHFGKKNNSKTHNQDCIYFLEWMISHAKERGIKTCIFGGDYHHHRSSINLSTLDYIMQSLDLLNSNFDKVYLITGNHDLFYREKRDVHSLILGRRYDNIVIIDSMYNEGDVAFVPWLVGDEWKKIKNNKAKYMFGHFEIPGFKMNAMVEMPDHGTINKTHFKNQDYVFSGHFHKRQQMNNIIYPGNPFGHDYSDVWDFDRGCMTLKWDGYPEFINWEEQPKYISCNISDVIDNPDKFLIEKAYVKVTVDVGITYEELNTLKKSLSEDYPVRELKFIPYKEETKTSECEIEVSNKSVDQVINEQLGTIDSDKFDTKKLIKIYGDL